MTNNDTNDTPEKRAVQSPEAAESTTKVAQNAAPSADENSSRNELKVEENKIKIISPGQMVLKRFFRSRLSVIGLVTLIVLFAFSFLGPLFSPWGEQTPDDTRGEPIVIDFSTTYAEMVSTSEGLKDIIEMCLTTQDGLIPFDPLDTASEIEDKISRNLDKLYAKYVADKKPIEYLKDGGIVYLEVEARMDKCYVYILEQTEDGEFTRVYHTLIQRTSSSRDRNYNAAPSLRHWLGTDKNSFDIFTRLMYAGRISLTLGFVVVFIQTFLGILFGGLAGYFGKWVDTIVMRVIDMLYCLPQMPVLLIFSAILEGLGVPEGLKIYLLMAMLSIIGWAGIGRTVRGQILFLREQEYMVAAEALGLGVPRRIVKHLVPNVMPLLIVQMTLGLGSIILAESTLSYLGLGIKEPSAAWGTMINSSNDPIVLQFYPNQWIPAGVLIVLAVLAFNFVGDGLRDAFDPKMRR